MAYRDPPVSQDKVRRMVRQRRRLRRVKLASLVVSVLVVAGAAAIGVDRAVVFVHHLFPKHHHQKASRPSTTATTAPTTTTIPGPPRCASAQVEAYLYNWKITGGVLYEDVALANTSAAPCNLAGYVGLSVVAPGGGTLPSPVHDDPTLGASTGASTAPVVLAAGQRSWFEFSYPVDCATVLSPGQEPTAAPGECYKGLTLGVIVPLASTALEVTQPLSFTYGTAGFTVGPFGSGTPPAAPAAG